MKKQLKIIFPIVALAFLGWGCGLVSGVFTVDHEFDDFGSSSSATHLDTWGVASVDLNTNETYQDHKDKLKGIESVCLSATVTNRLNQPVSGEAWIAYQAYSNKADVMANGFRIFKGIALGPYESRHIGCGDIADIFENLDKLEEAVKIGQFWVYGFGNEETYDVTFSHNVLVLAIAAGL